MTETADHREVMMQAAAAYDHTKQHIRSLEEQLHKAVAALEAGNSERDALKLMIAEERNNAATYRNERDEAFTARADALAMLSHTKGLALHLVATLDQPEIPLPPARRKRNGKQDDAGVVDVTGVPNVGGAGSAMSTSA